MKPKHKPERVINRAHDTKSLMLIGAAIAANERDPRQVHNRIWDAACDLALLEEKARALARIQVLDTWKPQTPAREDRRQRLTRDCECTAELLERNVPGLRITRTTSVSWPFELNLAGVTLRHNGGV